METALVLEKYCFPISVQHNNFPNTDSFLLHYFQTKTAYIYVGTCTYYTVLVYTAIKYL